MKNYNNLLSNCKHALLIGVFGLTMIGCSSNKPATVTREDVDKNIEEARQATQEAEVQTQEAIETRKEFTADYRETKIKELENRAQEIDKRINELKKVAENSPNQSAVANVNQAINALQNEKNQLSNRIEQVKTIEAKDWSNAYTQLDESIKKIEETLTRLSESLK